MARLVHLNSLQALEAALRLGSLRKAADELGVTQAAIGQRIRSLELFLDHPLLQRGATGVTPTTIAALAKADLSAAFAQLEKVAEALNFDRVGALKLRVDADFLDLWLRDKLPDFHRDHPGIEIELLPDIGHTVQGADIEVFWGSRPDCAPLWSDHLVPVLNLELVDMLRSNDPTNLLEGMPLLHMVDKAGAETLGWSAWVSQNGHRRTGVNRAMPVRTWTDGIAIAKAGAGVLLVPSLLVHDLLAAGQLHPMSQPNPGILALDTFRINVLSKSTQRRAVAAFAQWLIETSAQFAAERQN